MFIAQNNLQFFFLLVVTTISTAECPPDIIAVISPESRVATLRVSLGDVIHRLKLPVGSYDYDLINNGNNCSLKVEIKGDYISVYLRMSHSAKVKFVPFLAS